ncbi:hypothetical protein J4429_00090 [Candidatus Pacearchaeota archaeon]|nr:hypothetical protein [Candidatus Pacearchaeota archaeon]
MQILERTKNEIEAKTRTMSDFLKIEYLELCSKKFTDIEIQRFCYKELAKLYENKFMYTEALKYITKLKGVCIMQREKVDCLFKEIELLTKSGYYEKADLSFREAVKELNENDRFELKKRITDAYYEEVKKLEKSSKFSGVIKVYENLIHYVVDNERMQIKRKMLDLYKRLGRVRESMLLEKELEGHPVKSVSVI